VSATDWGCAFEDRWEKGMKSLKSGVSRRDSRQSNNPLHPGHFPHIIPKGGTSMNDQMKSQNSLAEIRKPEA
jgi:hypothetical protein